MSVVFLHSYWSLLFAVLLGHWWVHFRHERCGCRFCSVVTPLRKATQLCPLFQQIWSARFEECLLVSSKVRASNTPKLQSPWIMLKGSWFPKMQVTEWCLAPCSGVHQQFLADQWSVQTICIGKGMENSLPSWRSKGTQKRKEVKPYLKLMARRVELLAWLSIVQAGAIALHCCIAFAMSRERQPCILTPESILQDDEGYISHKILFPLHPFARGWRLQKISTSIQILSNLAI